MKCSEIADLAPLYHSGELDAPRAAAFADHLVTCADCTQSLRQQSQLDKLLRAGVVADSVADAAAIERNVRERIAAEPAPAPHPLHASSAHWRVAGIASVAALLLLTVVYRHLSGPHSVYADAAADHRSEVADAHWRPWLTDPAAIAALAQTNGVAPRLLLALSPPGYHLARAKRCALAGKPFLHLVYSNGGQEFSAYLQPRHPSPDAAVPPVPLYTADFGAEHLGCVQTPDMTAMIVTDESAAAAFDLARSADATLNAANAHF